LRECSLCSAALDDSATTCAQCGQQVVVDPIAASPFQPAAEPVPATSASSPLPKTGLHQRELIAAVGAALVVAVLTLGMLMARGSSSTEVAAANRAENTRSRTSAAASTVAAPDTVKWSTANQSHWTGNRRNSAAFELDAENLVPIWLRQVRPLLVVRCMSKTVEAFVITDSAMKIEPQTDDHTVTFRFDNEPEVRERWQDADDHNALFAPDGNAFTRRLLGAHRLRFGYTPHNVDSVTAEFHVTGLAALIHPVAKNCGWSK